ncbi:MAG: DEAD/DEAH box helicase family protein [Candidatus Poseidoniales archaeon]|nr:DEAD/DEAH box helicase family protein [Candidatus Poseidoniales archaeon]
MPEQLPDFGNIHFSGTLRPSQKAACKVIEPQLKEGSTRLHVVAPPGSGKTVLGLYVWSDLVKKPALVLSPNSAIQAQWAARTSLFDLDGKDKFVSTDPKNPGLLTSLTYQSVTAPGKGGEDIETQAKILWADKLLEEGEAYDFESCVAWQTDLKERNRDYYEDRLATYRKKARDAVAKEGNAISILSPSARQNLERLKKVGIGLIILDECHHLMHHWGRILAEVKELFDDPIVLGLTATPPDAEDFDDEDVKRYEEFFGPVDYQVPVPALVREANLAPYQDLCYFVRPSASELQYIAGVDSEFEDLLIDLRSKDNSEDNNRVPDLDTWVFQALEERKSPGGKTQEWSDFQRKSRAFADDGRRYLQSHLLQLPEGVPIISLKEDYQPWTRMSMLRTVLDRYVRYGLRRSKNVDDHKLSSTIVTRLRMLGVQITETGSRPCASPVGRVMAYSSGKIAALNNIISSEKVALGDKIRAVIVTDFEKTSATSVVEGILDDEAGGAIAVFRSLCSNEEGDSLDPVLMTGSTVLVDDDLFERFITRAKTWVIDNNVDVKFVDKKHEGYHEVRGVGEDWKPRYYSLMITEFFQEGLTKCLIGTRGLLGEGWDASRINVLVDLTTVTTSMSINQLRGRSIRLDSNWEEKVANNWDIVCLAEEFTKGFDDYERFKEKHKQLYGVCDDGTIEKGVGHVHAAFNDAKPEGVNEGMEMFNQEMIERSKNRAHVRELWGIGQPFEIEPSSAIEAKVGEEFAGGFKLGIHKTPWTDDSLMLEISKVIVDTLSDLKEIDRDCEPSGGNRGGGWLRYHLEHASEEETEKFTKALEEVLGPLDKPRYIISRPAMYMRDTWLSKLMPEVIAKFLRKEKKIIQMYHKVPSIAANSKQRAEVFLKHWNYYIGISEITYCHTEEGKKVVEDIKNSGLGPKNTIHRKEVYL